MSERFENRIGHDNFVWWVGVIEDVDDELNLGRVRVRIFGAHTEDLNLIPTKSLPWAIPLYPTNNSHDFAVPDKGSYAFGFFSDGLSKQAPVIMGVFPSIPQEIDRAGVGFSAKAEYTNSDKNEAEHIKTIPKNQAEEPVVKTSANNNSTEVTQQTAPGMAKNVPGKPSTPANVYTTKNTALSIANSDTVHACDFKFLIQMPDLTLGVIEDPIALIKKSIKNAKNKAAAIMQAFIAWLADQFRLTLDGIIATLNLDPTGEVSKMISAAKKIIRDVNYYSKLIAEYIGNAALVIELVKQLKTLVDWIKSLPAQILAMLKDCLLTFQKGILDAANQIKAIPGQIEGSITDVFSQLATNTQGTIDYIQNGPAMSSAQTNTFITIVNSPHTANVATINVFFTTTYANNEVVLESNRKDSYNVSNTSLP